MFLIRPSYKSIIQLIRKIKKYTEKWYNFLINKKYYKNWYCFKLVIFYYNVIKIELLINYKK